MNVILRTLGTLLFMVMVGCTALEEGSVEREIIHLKLNWNHGVQFLGFYAADQQGFYAEQGLAVIIDAVESANETTALTQQVLDGEYEFSVGSGLVTEGQANGDPIIVFGTVLQLSPNAFFVRADSGINSPADFAGHTVAIKSEIGRNNLSRMLALAGATIDDVIEVSSGFDLDPFINGEVDIWAGYLTDEVIRIRQQGIDVVTFPLYEYGMEGTAVSLFTRQEFLESNPELATRFLSATIKGWEWAASNPVKAVDMMIEQFPEMEGDREFHIASFDAYIPLLRPPGKQIGEINCEEWLSDPRLSQIESRSDLCTTTIYDAVRSE